MSKAFNRIRPLYAALYFRARKNPELADGEAASAIWSALNDSFAIERIWNQPGIAKRLMYFAWGRAKRQVSQDLREHEQCNHLVEQAASCGGRVNTRPGTLVSAKRELSSAEWRELLAGIRDDPDVMPPDSDLENLRGVLVTRYGLSPSSAELVVEHAVLGTSHEKIAHKLRVSAATIRQRYHRAIKSIRKLIPPGTQPDVTLLGLFDMVNREGDAVEIPSPPMEE
jgi:DNA-directed RNA polymerase specialized sigma24 family protein